MKTVLFTFGDTYTVPVPAHSIVVETNTEGISISVDGKVAIVDTVRGCSSRPTCSPGLFAQRFERGVRLEPRMNYSDALPNQEGYYWKKDKSGLESVRRVFLNHLDNLCMWTTNPQGKPAVLPLERFEDAQWAGPIASPGTTAANTPPRENRICHECGAVYSTQLMGCTACGRMNPEVKS